MSLQLFISLHKRVCMCVIHSQQALNSHQIHRGTFIPHQWVCKTFNSSHYTMISLFRNQKGSLMNSEKRSHTWASTPAGKKGKISLLTGMWLIWELLLAKTSSTCKVIQVTDGDGGQKYGKVRGKNNKWQVPLLTWVAYQSALPEHHHL